MAQRTQEQWQALIQQQATSGLTAQAFCTQQHINPKYFSQLKGKLTQPKAEGAAFIRIKPSRTDANIVLHYQRGTLTLTENTDAAWLATLLRELWA